MAPIPEGFDYGSWSAVYNATSFGIAGMGSCCCFVYMQIPYVGKKYKTALMVNCLVTLIATYHYFRIFNSWVSAFDLSFDPKVGYYGEYKLSLTGEPFNDAYRYVDWLLTVPLLLIELILVMGLPAEETTAKCWSLGLSSALMVALGYPGEIQNKHSVRWFYWACAMMPFLYVVSTLAIGLSAATSKLPPTVAGLVTYARWLTIISWCTYPGVYIIKMLDITGVKAVTLEQIGYSFADFFAKAVFGALIWAIAAEKTAVDEQGALLSK